MATTKEDIKRWLAEAKREKATHMMVVCDTFDHEDYPVSVKRGEDVHEKYKEYNGPNMQRVMEVYCMHLPLEPQLAEHRAFHFDDPPALPAKKTPKKRKTA